MTDKSHSKVPNTVPTWQHESSDEEILDEIVQLVQDIVWKWMKTLVEKKSLLEQITQLSKEKEVFWKKIIELLRDSTEERKHIRLTHKK